MIRMENSKSVMAAVESYKAEMSRLGLPQEMAALNEANRRAHAPATVNSQKNEDYSDKMNKELKEFFDSIVKRNQSVSQEMCTQLLGNLYQAIGDKVASGIFTRPGGHLAYNLYLYYKEEVERMEKQYNGVPD